ncbi:MAG: arginine--tRNA ligase, partial [Candidatus Paceibacterota bacterium]
MIQEKLRETIHNATQEWGVRVEDIHLEHPADFTHGDFSTNIAFQIAGRPDTRKSGNEEGKPRELAEKIAEKLRVKESDEIEKIEVAGGGFINFFLSKQFFNKSLDDAIRLGDEYGKNKIFEGKRVIIEYTNANPFKE